MNLNLLAEPFPAEDVEWRVVNASRRESKISCLVVAYITARAIQARLDEVCGVGNWKNEPLQVFELRPGIVAMQVGLSIRIEGEWVTMWEVAEPTDIEPAKGGFSNALKRCGVQWGIGRYLYHLPEMWADTSLMKEWGAEWNRGYIKKTGEEYWWKTPELPSCALPKEAADKVSKDELNAMKEAWRKKYMPDVKDKAELRKAFALFLQGTVGDLPASDHTMWTKDALETCLQAIESASGGGIAADVPFGGE